MKYRDLMVARLTFQQIGSTRAGARNLYRPVILPAVEGGTAQDG